nr:hypothetical protein GCM10020241_51390 [Streptoalloteichus tenebrarius]
MIQSPEEFVRLRTSSSPDEYRRASQEHAPLEVWLEVVRNYPEMREWVARNKTVPLEILASLASDPDPRVRHAVAMKRGLSSEILNKLSNDEDASVRLQVALHPKAPKEILDAMKNDSWERVREEVARRLAQ